VVVRCTAEPSAQAELERVLKLADEVIRHKILVAPQPRPRKERKERKEATASPAPAEARAR
jgi:ribosomal protein S6